MNYSRRQFGKIALGGIPVASALFSSRELFAAEKPNSRFKGVQIGIIVPYSYHNMAGDPQSLLDDMVRDGISSCEFHAEPIEEFLGAPATPGRGGRGGRGPGGPPPGEGGGRAPVTPEQLAARGRGRAPLTPEQLAAQKAAREATTNWRISVPMEKFKGVRKMFNDAGVNFFAYKLQLTLDMPDGEYDYTFNAAKALGASVVSMEMPTSSEVTQRVGEFATKHKMMVGYHGHLQSTPTLWDEAMSQSEYNGINLDAGHYVAAGNHDVREFIKKNHARITHVHLKDRKSKENGGENMPWGQGDTHPDLVLQLMRDQKYKFPGIIELEYAPPEGSDSEKEIVKCLAYCKTALT